MKMEADEVNVEGGILLRLSYLAGLEGVACFYCPNSQKWSTEQFELELVIQP
jgi:hypothetical protein